MGVFADYARKYWESEYAALPVHGKKAFESKFQRFSESLPTEEEMDRFESEFGHCNLGVVLGYNDLVCLDIDYDESDREEFIRGVLNAAPISTVVKKGKKGLSLFYRGKVPGKKIKHPKDSSDTVVEILSKGNYTVLPPSIHPETNLAYVWMSEQNLLNTNISDLPTINEQDVSNIVSAVNYFFSNKTQRKKPGRNNSLGAYAFRCANTATSIDEIVSLVMKHDEDFYGINSYFKDPKENHGKPPHEFATAFVKRAINWLKADKAKRGIKWELGFKESNDEFDIYKEFFNIILSKAKKCKLKDVVYLYENKNSLHPIENSIKTIQSFSRSKGLDHTKIEIHLQRWMYSIPGEILTDIYPWDGVSRVKDFFNHVNVSGIKQEYFNEVMTEWASNIFKRVNDNKFQNFCPIWCGDQGLGKDTFIGNLLDGLGTYFANISVNDSEERNFQNIYGKIVCNISEFDKAAKAHPAVLKNMITSPQQTFRFPYDRRPTDAKFYCSFIGSSNTNEVLFDSTGSRRFAVFSIKKIDFSYKKDLGRELLSEIIHLSEVGYKASKDAWAAVNENLELLTPDTEDGLKDSILNEWAIRSSEARGLYIKKNNWNKLYLTQEMAYPIILDLANKFKFSQFKIRNILKSAGMQRVNSEIEGSASKRVWYSCSINEQQNTDLLQQNTDFEKPASWRDRLTNT
ncbi:MAG: hypothetical protein E6R04_08140 [Spirochaetes bacterium]|nr:MAG: hypothetical protein E6R04_08140 [Spirochaetota bacterium]